MALYRHNATGFIGEFATNPGAGYTAISSMPTTSIAARANWWRGIDTHGQTSDWHPSVDDDAEDPNDNYLALVFTNEAALVSADADGNVTDGFLGATTQVRVMRGSRNVTESEGWSLGLGKSPDVPSFTYTWTGTDYKTLQITGFPVDETSGYIRITAVRSGSQTLEKDFKFLKVIKGEDGGSGVVIDLSNQSHVVPTDGLGNNGNFTGCASTASIYLGSSDDSANWNWTATPSGGVTGTATNSNRTFTVSAMSTDVGTVTFTATKTGFPNQTVVFSISKAKGGIAFSLQTSVSAVNKNSAGLYTPSTITASAIQTTTSGISSYSGRFRVETQATRDGAWTERYTSVSNESTTTYTIPASVVSVRFTLYAAGGTSSQLDQEAIPITFDGANGSSGIVIDLTNQAHVVPTDGNGENGNFSGCNSTASIYLGSSDDSANWNWTVSASAGITGVASNSNRTYTVSAMSVDTGTVTFSATKSGSANQTAVFSISKAKGGIAYQIEPSVGAINKSSAGAYTPSAISFSSYRTTTTTRQAFSAYFYIERQSSLGGAWSLVYQSSTPQTSYSYSIPSNTFGVRGAIYLTAGQFLDVEAVPVVMDGTSGERGSRQFVFNGTSWSDTAAWDGIVTATGGNPVLTDLVTIANASAGFSQSKFCTANTSRPGTWVQPDSYINGNLLVTGTVGADKLVANSITASQIASNTITTSKLSFTPVQSTNVVASINASAEGIRITGNRITLDGTVSFGVGYDPTGKIVLGGAAADVNNNVTTISGGKITTGSITTAQLNFAPVTTSNVVASINATAEGIRIAGNRITLDGTVSFGDGYDPTTKITTGGAATDINNNVTTISGGKITTGSITASQIATGTITTSNLNFTPITGTNVLASINASAEGIRISGSRITLDGNVSFASGYDPSGKINSGGAATDINNNVTTINGGKITTGTLTANAIGTGTITAATINLDGSSAVIRTSNFSLGTGFRIAGDGSAFFYGAATTGSARSTNWNGYINPSTGQPSAGTGTAGWCIDSAGNAEFNTVMVRTGNVATNAITKMIGATGMVVNFSISDYSNSVTASISCDGGDLYIQVHVRLMATGTWMGGSSVMNTTYGVFTLIVNGSSVDSVTLYATKDPNASAGIATSTLSYYLANVGTQTVSYYVSYALDGVGSRQVTTFAINGKR